MIIDYLSHLGKKQIILASQSPRRQEILNLMGLTFTVQPSSFSEDLPKINYATPQAYAIATAVAKGKDVHKSLSNDPDLIIASDTVVVLDNAILEKPASEGKAFEMLQLLNGRTHTVVTAVSLIAKNGVERSFCETTDVTFGQLSADMISAYIKTGEPMDKAGAYGIQGYGGAFVKRIEGCYFSVMGLPMYALSAELRRLLESGLL